MSFTERAGTGAFLLRRWRRLGRAVVPSTATKNITNGGNPTVALVAGGRGVGVLIDLRRLQHAGRHTGATGAEVRYCVKYASTTTYYR